MIVTLFRPAVAALLSAATLCSSFAQSPAAPDAAIPPAPREFRGVWIATVANIDWPSKPTLSVSQQKAELIRQLDQAREMKLNAVIFQVRPASDAFYHSALEPWSEFLTGQQGKAPMPFYDPLHFAVEEAHKRGLELHAWFNPYRVSMPGMKSKPAPNSLPRTRPDLVKSYGTHLWLDPGEKGTQDHVQNVIMDVVRRYDIDGVHFDDYFYPYKSYNGGKPFPDDASYQKYKAAGGTLNRDDWRRENVNILVRNLNQSIHALKPHVRFGIAPFGIWKSGHPSTVVGLNSHDELYNDSRKWIQEGWVDYIAPQLYWKVTAPKQPYADLVKWWVEQSKQGRHVWPGLIPSRVAVPKNGWLASEVVDQIVATRRQPGATGHILFSFKPLMRDQGGITKALTQQVYRGRALVPASPWLDSVPPSTPAAAAISGDSGNEMVVRWQGTGDEAPWLWGLYAKIGGSWSFEVLPAGQTSITFPRSGPGAPSVVAISAVDRVGNESPRAVAYGQASAAGQMSAQAR